MWHTPARRGRRHSGDIGNRPWATASRPIRPSAYPICVHLRHLRFLTAVAGCNWSVSDIPDETRQRRHRDVPACIVSKRWIERRTICAICASEVPHLDPRASKNKSFSPKRG